MLYPIATDSRVVMDLSGVWKFMIDKEVEPIEVSQALPTDEVMAVPASFNDQTVTKEIRSITVIFGTKENFLLPRQLRNERLVLRFGSATHEAWVYLNGKEIAHHKGGFTPFEVEINDFLSKWCESFNGPFEQSVRLYDFTSWEL